MAFIDYPSSNAMPESNGDDDNILRIHGVHRKVIKLHYDLYVELMHKPSPLSRAERELVGTFVSGINGCHY